MTNYEMIKKLERKQLALFLKKFACDVIDDVCNSCVHAEICELRLEDPLFECMLDDTAAGTMDAWLGMEARDASISKD